VRAWELVGGRDAGIVASLAVLAGRDRQVGERDDDEGITETEE
jgi:hypothetical protein